MASHALVSDEARRDPRRRTARSPLTQLGWPQYWLLSAILGGMLALVALAFLIATQT
ncbi:MAG TPA: hypothetical protein VFK57_11735 [Vicinamibacterales bacterium]|nr:hypothetical protein [Vicinamibacterales bacterium]